MYKFASAAEDEPIVFGSARPGYRNEQVKEWIKFMQYQDIKRVCCLLPESQLTRYSNLLDVYRQTFGLDQVCWTPIEDFHFADAEILIHQILPFLAAANQNHEKVVVHCSGGVGRTGHVLAAWLVVGRGLSNKTAIATVKQTGKNPYEAVIAAPFKGRNPWKVAAELQMLLDECNRFRDKLA
ncbi:dual specificity protein phosphatase family protein [Gloeocapsopsis crepidinum LEGE 06123]|uniref:Dual specificity protein phosphatase family protein n=1 Tax=Gloeocapsopsis crepidinum LEGE 06123 TaxID=588587 RepID=A0ABR9ULB8_9CHRO|nr:dual specificity protein phosphatase family protein [Gloeocapsopsis crepidinum]MBE9189054.1 dual specificity protein phosphatase family protein [Gloeocapsopsis crepidinum LEGE 06123]